MSPSTEAGRLLRFLLNEADIHWPDDMTRLAGDVLAPQIAAIEAEARAALLAELEEDIAVNLGHDLRELAQDAEKALHCIWPTMMLRVLDLIRKAGEK